MGFQLVNYRQQTHVVVVEFRAVEIDFCPDCGGSWFDQGEMALLLGREEWEPAWREGAAPAAEAEAKRKCPRCRKAMAKWSLGPLTVDRCRTGDGIWFDRGELDGMVRQELPEESDVVAFVKDLFGGEGDGS